MSGDFSIQLCKSLIVQGGSQNKQAFLDLLKNAPSVQQKVDVISRIYDGIVNDSFIEHSLDNVRKNLKAMITWLNGEYWGILSMFDGFTLGIPGVRKMIDCLKRKGSVPCDFSCSVCEDSLVLKAELSDFEFKTRNSTKKENAVFFVGHQWLGMAHMSCLYVEKLPGNPIRFLVSDSLAKEKLMEWFSWLFERLSEQYPESPIYAFSVERQSDTCGCKIFCLRDLVYLSNHDIFNEIDGYEEGRFHSRSVAKIPSGMFYYTQSYTKIKDYCKNELFCNRAAAKTLEEKANRHKVCIENHEINRLIADRSFKYGKRLILDWISKGWIMDSFGNVS